MQTEDALIVGAGPIGLACAISAKRRGLDPLVIDAGPIANSIVQYPIGMTFFTSPDKLEIGGHPMVCAAEKPTREEALQYYRGVVRTESLRVETYSKLTVAERGSDGLACTVQRRLDQRVVRAARLVLATGYFDRANRLGVPGEDLPHVHHYFDEAHRGAGLEVAVIGGGNSAVEAALELFRAGARTTLIHRQATVRQSVKYWIKPDIENRIAAGEVRAFYGTTVKCFSPEGIVVTDSGAHERHLRADRVYVLIGFQPDFGLFERSGIQLAPETRVPAHDPTTLETNVPGVFMAGSITRGRAISEVFIENGRFDGEKVFGDR